MVSNLSQICFNSEHASSIVHKIRVIAGGYSQLRTIFFPFWDGFIDGWNTHDAERISNDGDNILRSQNTTIFHH
jgi:hypothetical protein